MRAKAKRETPKRRGGSDRRGSRDGAARKTRRNAADSTARRTRPAQGLDSRQRRAAIQIRTANQPQCPAGRAVGPTQE